MIEYLSKNSLSDILTTIKTALAGKVDKVTGKQLSTEDYTTNEKNKLAGIASNATADSASNTTPIANKVTAKVGTETAYARGDHAHPLQEEVVASSYSHFGEDYFEYPITFYSLNGMLNASSTNSYSAEENTPATVGPSSYGNLFVDAGIYAYISDGYSRIILGGDSDNAVKTGELCMYNYRGERTDLIANPSATSFAEIRLPVSSGTLALTTDITTAVNGIEQVSPYTSTPEVNTDGGSAGTADKYARGDHSHPLQEETVLSTYDYIHECYCPLPFAYDGYPLSKYDTSPYSLEYEDPTLLYKSAAELAIHSAIYVKVDEDRTDLVVGNGWAGGSTAGGIQLYNEEGTRTQICTDSSITSAIRINLPASDGTLALTSEIEALTYDDLGAAAKEHTHLYAGSTEAGGAATSVTVTSTNPTSTERTYFPVWSASTGTGSKELYMNDSLRISTLQGTDTQNGYGILTVGNSTPYGTSGNKSGKLRLYGLGVGYVQFETTNTSSNSYTITVPAESGTIALEGVELTEAKAKALWDALSDTGE